MFNRCYKAIAACLLISLVSLMTGCGGSNAGGQGNTVYLTAYSKPNTTVAFNTIPSTMQSDSIFSYTIKSTAYPGITPSAAVVTGANISFTQISGPASVPLASWYAPFGITVPAGGEGILDNAPVISAVPAYPTNIGAYLYKVSVQFLAREDTGQDITCNAVDTFITVTPTVGTADFLVTDTTATTRNVTIVGGTGPYTFPTSPVDLNLAQSGNVISINLAANNVTSTLYSGSITVLDSLGKKGYIYVTYYQ